MALLEDTKSVLQAAGIDEDIYLSFLPRTSDDVVIALYDTFAISPKNMMGEDQVTRPAVEVQIRSTSYPAGRAVATEIYNALHKTKSGSRSWWARQSGPQTMGRDDSQRILFLMAFDTFDVDGGF